jgi:hypothetical protein
MTKVDKALRRLRNNPENSWFIDLKTVCDWFFGPPRHSGGSHMVFRTGLIDDPRLVIQNRGGAAKSYQVRQVLTVLDRLERGNNHD